MEPHVNGWAILTKRYGADIRQPSEADLGAAMDELLIENTPGMTEQSYAEHPNAWLRYGFDGGPVFVVEVSRRQSATFLKYADQDDADPLSQSTLAGVAPKKLLELWKWLAVGEIDRIKSEYPSCGW